MTWPFFNVIIITLKLVTHYYNIIKHSTCFIYMLLLARFMLNIICCTLHIFFAFMNSIV